MNTYDYIMEKISSLKAQYPTLRLRTDDYVFSALCVKANFYKKPSLILNESDFTDIIVDGQSDGGADILLSDPNSDEYDLVVGQSKFHKTISQDTVINAVLKMARGHYEQFNSLVQSRFLTLYSDVGEESKIHFVFYTSAPNKKSIDKAKIEKIFREQFLDSSAIELSLLFADDIVDEIKDAESAKQIVKKGKIFIDETDNYLLYRDNAVIVNASAFSIQQLYIAHGNSLLARNLRYYIKGKNEKRVDNAILKTIKEDPDSFWLKNNGITIICDSFDIDGREVKLRNFSIVNGGQTTHQLKMSKSINADHDLWLPCKIIKILGDSEEEKDNFILEIAEAANTQKAIKPADLIANDPEQLRFKTAMLSIGIFYKNKRGDDVLKKYSSVYLHTELKDVGSLCLAGIFQEPCRSRNNPSVSYDKNKPYYNLIFNRNQAKVAQICKELLYIKYYFSKKFLPKFKHDNENDLNARYILPFASVSRATCIAFVALAARYHQGNIINENLVMLVEQTDPTVLYEKLCDFGNIETLLPIKLYTDAYDVALNKLFTAFIYNGTEIYSETREANSKVTETNFFKDDKNYYKILRIKWRTFKPEIHKIFSEV